MLGLAISVEDPLPVQGLGFRIIKPLQMTLQGKGLRRVNSSVMTNARAFQTALHKGMETNYRSFQGGRLYERGILLPWCGINFVYRLRLDFEEPFDSHLDKLFVSVLSS